MQIAEIFPVQVDMEVEKMAKYTQHNPYLWLNHRNFRVLKEIGVREHDGDARFKSRRGNMAISCTRNASSHNYRNNSFIVDLAMGQTTTRSTECNISSICIGFI